MRIFDLSLRHKIPLWGSALMLVAALTIAVAFIFRAYDDLKRDLFATSAGLGQTMAQTLFSPLLHDDVWRAFEIIQAPFHDDVKANPLHPELIFVLDRESRILAASDPQRLPTLASLRDLGADYTLLADALHAAPPVAVDDYDLDGARHYFIAVPIAAAERQVGTLVIGHDRRVFWTRFLDLAQRGALIGLLAVAAILPINWFWGRRTAEPLVELSKGMDALVHGHPLPLPTEDRYPYRDEIGQLYAAYREAAAAINQKSLLEKEILHAERLAAVGRLAAGIAHEVNNPLGGMLMAIDNLKQRGPLDAATAKTVDLLERGLQQVTETIGALLVESRVSSRSLNRHDFEDLRTLIEPQIVKKQIAIDWRGNLPETLNLPASIVRQILINLLLNATQATAPGGFVRLHASAEAGLLHLEVANQGDPLPADIRSHLFEPFVSGREGGHGLGLWVTYQTVVQLNGRIDVADEEGEVRFVVSLPLENKSG